MVSNRRYIIWTTNPPNIWTPLWLRWMNIFNQSHHIFTVSTPTNEQSIGGRIVSCKACATYTPFYYSTYGYVLFNKTIWLLIFCAHRSWTPNFHNMNYWRGGFISTDLLWCRPEENWSSMKNHSNGNPGHHMESRSGTLAYNSNIIGATWCISQKRAVSASPIQWILFLLFLNTFWIIRQLVHHDHQRIGHLPTKPPDTSALWKIVQPQEWGPVTTNRNVLGGHYSTATDRNTKNLTYNYPPSRTC